MPSTHVLNIQTLGNPWPTFDPFLFCVHHNDHYPRGDGKLGPNSSLVGRNLGQDFGGKDGWNMYHGDQVPGFPAHPHRGFETITLVRQGFIDHTDSLGATARFGNGDVQWLTAGRGIVHSEMFPLLNTNTPNPTELFQIWLNLPAKNKMAPPHFTMYWSAQTPRIIATDDQGISTMITCHAGQWDHINAPPPPPASWANEPDSGFGICTIKMPPHGRWTIPATPQVGVRRQLYFFTGANLSIGGEWVASGSAIEVRSDIACPLTNGEEATELLILQGKPIGEPIAQHGPFVMNTAQEIQQAFVDYRRTQFGGWPWDRPDPTHGDAPVRFARHADDTKTTV